MLTSLGLRTSPLVDLPIPIIGGILNFCVFMHHQIYKAKPERPWEEIQDAVFAHGTLFRSPFLCFSAITAVDHEGIKTGFTMHAAGEPERVLAVQTIPSIQKVHGVNALHNLDIGPARDKIKRYVHGALAAKSLMGYLDSIAQDSKKFVLEGITQTLEASGQSSVIVKTHELNRVWAMTTPVRACLGLGPEADEIIARTRADAIKMWDGTFSLPFKWLGGQYSQALEARERIKKLILKDLIAVRREELASGTKKSDGDLLSRLVADSEQLDDDEIVDSCFTIFLAAYETTVTMVTTAIFHLAKPEYRDVLAKLRAEHEKFSDPVTYEDIKSMVYTRNFFFECLRVRPAVPAFFKSIKKSFKLQGFDVTPEYFYLYHLLGAQRNQEGVEDPDRIMPERLEDPNCVLNKPFHFTPFGGGATACPGKEFSLLEASLYLREIISQFNFEHAIPNPVQRSQAGSGGPTDGMPLRFTKRGTGEVTVN